VESVASPNSSSHPATLLIRVESLTGHLPADLFLRAARDLLHVAEEVSRSLTGMETQWHLAALNFEGPSPLDAARLPEHGPHPHADLVIAPANQPQVAQQIRQGIRAIHSHCEERPEGFTDNALRALRRVATLSGRKYRVSVSAGQGSGEAVWLDENIVTQVDAWLRGQRDAVGSVEGTLEIISIHTRPRFTIYWRGGTRIECQFPEEMLPDVAASLGKRVRIRGHIWYRRDGQPATVEALSLRRLPPLPELPAVEEMMGSTLRLAAPLR
jgi:hypothetical protein